LPLGVERPRIDAALDDPAWQHALAITEQFLQSFAVWEEASPHRS